MTLSCAVDPEVELNANKVEAKTLGSLFFIAFLGKEIEKAELIFPVVTGGYVTVFTICSNPKAGGFLCNLTGYFRARTDDCPNKKCRRQRAVF